MIEVQNLVKKYGQKTAVKGISFKVDSGKIYGFLGPNGAGKSTTMNIMTGCLSSTEGKVLINGHDIFEEPKKAKKCIGYLPEIPPVYTDMTPYEYLSFVGKARGVKKSELVKQLKDIMELTGITGVANRLIGNLSKGYRQRVGIAQAIVGYPEIIILDEPMVGLDPKQIIEIRELIRSLGENHTVFFSSHILSEVNAICDYVMIIADGKLVASDTPENLSRRLKGNSIELTVKGNEKAVVAALNKIKGVEAIEVISSDNGQVVLKIHAENDIRSEIFFALSEIKASILGMTASSFSLEDIFLKLTDKDSLEEDDSDDEDDADEEDEDDDDDGEYTPMFTSDIEENGGNDEEDNDDEEDKKEKKGDEE
ncbi:MAG: ABC transporter ATP-binding protein [Clostridia bacterium]|nr:ABC transporter ATP-binding protein [Clostridia bacterium]